MYSLLLLLPVQYYIFKLPNQESQIKVRILAVTFQYNVFYGYLKSPRGIALEDLSVGLIRTEMGHCSSFKPNKIK